MHLNKRWIDRRVYEYFAVNIAPLLNWRDPILVYQMGKVGSSSIRNSLFRCRDPRTRLVLMSHEFHPLRERDPDRTAIEPESRDYLRRAIEHDRRVYRGYSRRRRLGLRFRERFYSERIYKAYVQSGQRLRVITLVREPVANNVSMFFQLIDQYSDAKIQRSNHDIDELIGVFLTRYLHSRPLVWFDAELRITLGIDVFQHPFPVDKGYTVISSSAIELLVLKCELDDRAKARAIAQFLDLEDFEIVRSNVTSQKPYADQYAEFKRRLRIPLPLLDELYESKYARHFYSEGERARLRARWADRTGRTE